MTRDELLQRVQQDLRSYGFTYQNFSTSNSSFDLIARKQNVILIIKTLANVDALRPEHARDLQKMALVFHAHPLIIGEKTKVFGLQPDVLYERYDLPVLSIDGFQQLLQGNYPQKRGFKGKYAVELDAQRLRKEREAKEMTLESLSRKAGVSLESLHRYEHGQPAQLDVAEKLEEILHAKLIRGINVFSMTPTIERQETISLNAALEQLEELGLKLSVFERAPLTAAGTEQSFLVSHSESRHTLAKKALLLEKTQQVLRYPGILVAKESSSLNMGNVPVVKEEELGTFSSVKDILRTLDERKKRKR